MHYPAQQQLYRSTLTAPEFGYGHPYRGPANTTSNGIWAHGAPGPLQPVPHVSTEDTTYYCKELNGLFQLRTVSDIMNNCQPGDWRKNPETNFAYFVRRAAD